ncbi:hypothetical protein [Streptomyces sp. NPDC048565]|uniref:hypothetical protein n=1 Tax=Streptomyces sp. NPDC048565 TaxID=3155266 RepID=UPI00341D19BC
MDQKDTQQTLAMTAWIPAASSAAVALAVWGSSRRTRVHMGGGFEGQGQDESVLWTELPLVLLGAGLLPMAVWLLTFRALRTLRTNVARGNVVMIAAVAALAVTVLYAWGLYTWTDQLDPEHVRSLGSHLHL